MTQPILDPVTGLPLDPFASTIDQIPLGQQVFPFADLQATDRMNRPPMYGDDVIPTTSLVTGQDAKGTPRAGRMDSARNLYTRDAVFQSGGAPIPDGQTAAIDVNVTGGGGASSPTVINPLFITSMYVSKADFYVDTANTWTGGGSNFGATIEQMGNLYGFSVVAIPENGATTFTGTVPHVRFGIGTGIGARIYELALLATEYGNAAAPGAGVGRFDNVWLPYPISLSRFFGAGQGVINGFVFSSVVPVRASLQIWTDGSY